MLQENENKRENEILNLLTKFYIPNDLIQLLSVDKREIIPMLVEKSTLVKKLFLHYSYENLKKGLMLGVHGESYIDFLNSKAPFRLISKKSLEDKIIPPILLAGLQSSNFNFFCLASKIVHDPTCVDISRNYRNKLKPIRQDLYDLLSEIELDTLLRFIGYSELPHDYPNDFTYSNLFYLKTNPKSLAQIARENNLLGKSIKESISILSNKDFQKMLLDIENETEEEKSVSYYGSIKTDKLWYKKHYIHKAQTLLSVLENGWFIVRELRYFTVLKYAYLEKVAKLEKTKYLEPIEEKSLSKFYNFILKNIKVDIADEGGISYWANRFPGFRKICNQIR